MRTLYFDETSGELVIIDQTMLPQRVETIRIASPRELYDAIKTLALRGAPAIGVGAALGLYASALQFEDTTTEGFRYSFSKSTALVNSARPTARNLSYACERMIKASEKGETVEDILSNLKEEAFNIEREDIEICHAIGKSGEPLIKDGATVLTHCNAGGLCAVEYGTALAPIYEAQANGKTVHVYSDETRPLLQGARLTCFELTEAGIDTTLICDNMAASLMAAGKIDIVIVGCDRVAKNGDFANKIGTLSVAVNAKYFGVPFYVAVPPGTVDENTPTGKDIVIEQRDGKEITKLFFSEQVAPDKVKLYNPAFDVTPASLVTGYITEKGVLNRI